MRRNQLSWMVELGAGSPGAHDQIVLATRAGVKRSGDGELTPQRDTPCSVVSSSNTLHEQHERLIEQVTQGLHVTDSSFKECAVMHAL